MNDILSPKTLWENFDEKQPLKESIVSTSVIGGVNYSYVYFSGRKVGNSRVRIYGLYAERKNVKADTIIILPDVNDTIDADMVSHFVRRGFNVLSVDLGGKKEGLSDFTIYPEKISYANFTQSGRYFTHVDDTAIETSWYEWTAVAKYAVSYLKHKNPKGKVGVIGIKQGANVAWQLSATDLRVNCSAFAFGAGWLAYKGIYKHSGEDIELNEERYRFLAGVEAHTYAQHVEIPVLFLGTTNNDEFDAERALDTLQRVNNDDKCWFNLVTNSKEILDEHCLNDVNLFFDKYLSGHDSKLYNTPKIFAEYEEESIVYTVECDSYNDVESIHVFASSNDVKPSERLWFIVPPLERGEDGEFLFKRRIYGHVDFDLSFAVVKYKNGLTISSRFNYSELNVTSNSKLPNVIFSTAKLPTNFFVESIKTQLIGGVFSKEKLYQYVVGPYNIEGVLTNNPIVSYAVKNLAKTLNKNSFIKFDAYAPVPDTLTIKLTTTSGSEYFARQQFDGESRWVNVSIDLDYFKADNGMPLSEFDKLLSITLSSCGSVAINNFLFL